MNLRILKNDLKRRKSVNIILFIFITIATVFLASSINNILVVVSAVDYYMDYANVPDINIIVNGSEEQAQIEDWLKNEAPGVTAYGHNFMISMMEKDIHMEKDGDASAFTTDGASLYMATTDADYCKVFDTAGRPLDLQAGELAMTQSLMDKNGITPGDLLTIRAGDITKTLTVKSALKDAAYGSEMVGMSRIIISPEDYSAYTKEHQDMLDLYYVDTENSSAFSDSLNSQGFMTVMNSFGRSTYTLVYSFDMIIAALLILIGICLILIALLVLRFTLVFTIEEDYREIGIMKAVGLKNPAIRKLYLIKYLVIVTVGALLGLAASIPVSRVMVAGVSKNMIMEDSGANFFVNIICTMLIIALVMLFCYSCTRKLNKISAIMAIRGGQSGERFNKKAGLKLYRRKWMGVPVFLGLNDMFCHVRRYLVLMITFCLSFILITIPLNTINTMQSREMVDKFNLDPDSAVYLRKIEAQGDGVYKNSAQLLDAVRRVEKEMADKGYDASITVIPIYFISYNVGGTDNNRNIMTTQLLGENNDYQTFDEGQAPVLANEIAFSVPVMEASGWKIGDTVTAVIGGNEHRFVITGTYSDYMQLGSSARLNPVLDCGSENMFDYWNILVDMDTDKNQEELAEELTEIFPAYQWDTAQEIIDRNVGGVQQSLKDMLIPMTGMLCAVIMLITLLMERLFIVREKGEIAMMKSVGYKNRSIRLWQVLRMVWVALVSMVAAIPLSLLCNRWVLKPIFAIMGANVTIQVVPWQVYGIYPGVLLLGIIIATMAATGKVKKINIREMNNLE